MKDNEIIKALVKAAEEFHSAEAKAIDRNVIVPYDFVVGTLDILKEQKAEIQQKDTEIAILLRKKEALRDEIEELQSIIESIYTQLRELELLAKMMEVRYEG